MFRHPHQYLNDLLYKIAERKNVANVQELTKEVHVWPDFHGNRSPLADPNFKGMVSGLTMSVDEDSLAIQYLAFIQALAVSPPNIYL